MIDIKAVRANPEKMKENIEKRNLKVDLDTFLDMDKKIIQLNQELDALKASKNLFSKLIPTLSNEEKQIKLIEMKAL
jgi:seryl-tRNA synthetase